MSALFERIFQLMDSGNEKIWLINGRIKGEKMSLIQRYMSTLAMFMTMALPFQSHADSSLEESIAECFNGPAMVANNGQKDSCTCSPSCCTKVEGGVLVFNASLLGEIEFDVEGEASAAGSYSVQFFVTGPSGCTVLSQLFTGAFNVNNGDDDEITIITLANKKIPVCPVCCGTYHAGVIVKLTNLVTTGIGQNDELDFHFGSRNTILSVLSNCPVTDETFLPNTVGRSVDLTNIPTNGSITIQYDYPSFTYAPDCCVVKPSCNCCGGCCK